MKIEARWREPPDVGANLRVRPHVTAAPGCDCVETIEKYMIQADTLKKYYSDISLVALVAANMIPIYGVVALGWDAFSIVLLYWAENIVIGFYNILKIAFAKVEPPILQIGKLFTIPFFTLHYSAFVGGHGLFIFLMFGKGEGNNLMPGSHPWPCFLIFVQMLFNVIRHCWTTIPMNMKYMIGTLFLSHGVSFVRNYILGGEYLTAKPQELMGRPYSRIVVMHIAIIAGGFLTAKMGSPVGILIVLVVLKTILDITLHLRQHRKTIPPDPTPV
jgi:hypothetical protein